MDETDGDDEVFGLDEDDARAGGDGHEEMRRGVCYPGTHVLWDESRNVDGGQGLVVHMGRLTRSCEGPWQARCVFGMVGSIQHD